MKMVLVFDTDDRDGMKSSLKIMKSLARDHGLDSIMSNMDDPKFGKIEFIKMLKDFDVYSHLPNAVRSDGKLRLRILKDFADHVFDVKSNNSYYKPKWLPGHNK
jgi:hypothetical protein